MKRDEVFALMLLAASGGGCGSEGGATPVPACAAPAAVMGRVPYYECATTGVCPRQRVRNDVMRPVWRVTWLRPTAPSGIANAAVEEAVNTRIQNGLFLWAIAFDLSAGTFRTGGLNPANRTLGSIGLGLLDGQFRFFNNDATGLGAPTRYNLVTGTMSVMGDRATATAVTGTVRLPIFNPDGSLFTELPLTGLRISNVRLTADRGCIGEGRPSNGRFAEHTSAWNTVDDAGTAVGSMEAVISIADTRAVSVTLGATVVPLCDLLAGAPCAMPQAMWLKAPDAMVDGMPAWQLRADFAAVSVTVRP